MFSQEDIGHFLTVDRIAALRQHVKLVAVFGKDADRRLEIAKKAEMRR
jgi:hypothetical protein